MHKIYKFQAGSVTPSLTQSGQNSILNSSDPFGAVSSYSQYGQNILNLTSLSLGNTLSLSDNYLTSLLGKGMVLTTMNLMQSGLNSARNLFGSKITPTKSTKGKGIQGFGNTMGTIGKAADLVSGFLPEKTEYSGTKGDITSGMDSAYDAISDAAMTMGPWGCVCAGTKVVTKEGEFKNIEDLQQEDGIIGWGDKQIKVESIFSFIEPHKKECLEIETESGTILRCSIDHPILTANSGRASRLTINGKRVRVKEYYFKRADLLQIGDNIGIANDIDIWGTKDMWEPYLIGMLIGDGTYGKDHGVTLFSADSDIWNYIEDNNLGVRVKKDNSDYNVEFRAYRITDGTKYLKALGIYELTKQDKRLPRDIYKYTKDSICKLIAGLIDTDGTVYCTKKENKVVFYLSNKELITQVRYLLLKLGIHSSLLTTTAKKSIIKDRLVFTKPGWKLIIKDCLSLINFYNLIHLGLSRKQAILEQIYCNCRKKSVRDNRYLSGAKSDKIISIISIGELIIYNLLADNDHTYLANGIITHNTMVGGIMKGGKLLGKGVNALGGGTDAMTTTDAILGSSFFNLTPVGLVNGFGGKKADTITKDNEAFAQVGSSYSGTSATVDDALTKSGKKYGLFSSGARKKANEEIAEAKRQQNIMQDIALEAQTRNTLKYSMSAINGNRYAFDLQGGYDQSAVKVGRHGMSLEKLNAAMKIVKALKGTVLKPDAIKVDKPLIYTPSLRELVINRIAKQSPNFINRLRNKDYRAVIAPDGGYGNVYVTSFDNLVVPQIQEIDGKLQVFNDPRDAWKSAMKSGDYLRFNSPEEAQYFGENYKTFPEFKDFFDNWDTKKLPQSYKEGGVIVSPESIANEPDFSEIELLNPASLAEIPDIEEFKEGGSINVIPDGALHARLHHMENADDLTKKGIPVVDNNGEQQAEIEKEEIIYRIEVTKKLEEMELEYYNENTSNKRKDELALEAGKLLVHETLYNTQDNTRKLL